MAGRPKQTRKLLPSEYSTRVVGVYTKWNFHLAPDPFKQLNLPLALVARLRRQIKSGKKAVARSPLLVRFLLDLARMTGKQAWFLPPITLLQSVVPAARFYLSRSLIEIATSVASGAKLDTNRLGLFVLGHFAVTIASRALAHWATEIQEVVQSRFNLEVKERILRIHCRLDSDDLNSDDAQQILQKVESLRNDGPHSGSFNLLAPLHLARGIVSLATEAAVLSTQINRSNAIILGFTTLLTVFNSWEGRYDNYWWEGTDLSNNSFMRLENIFNIGTSTTLRREVTTLNLQNHLISEFELARAELGSTSTRNLQHRPQTSPWEFILEDLLTEDFITYVAFALQSTWSSMTPTLESMSALALLRGGLQGLFYSLHALKFNFGSFTSDLGRIGAFYDCQDLEPSSPGGVAYVGPGFGLRGIRLDFRDVSMRYVPEGALVLQSISFSVDPGQLVAIVGHNGAGKSSLISLLAKSHSRSSGEILVNGVKIEDYARGELQEPSLPFTINEYVGLGSLAHRNDLERVASALKFAAADQVVATLPDGGLTYPGGVEGSMLDSQWKLPRVVPIPDADAVPEVDTSPSVHRYGRGSYDDDASLEEEDSSSDEDDSNDLLDDGVKVAGLEVDKEDLPTSKTELEEKELLKPARPSSTVKNTCHAQDSAGKTLRILYPAYSPAPSVLSGGQWQRIALARSMMKQDRNELMVFDEPAASLDPRAEAALFDKILELKGTSTIIFSTHRFNITAKADKILMFSAGHLVEQGTHAELMAIDGGEYRSLWEVQASGFQAIAESTPRLAGGEEEED